MGNKKSKEVEEEEEPISKKRNDPIEDLEYM
jgi:hypothetical protein